VLDEIHFGDGKVVRDVLLGGSGSFCTVGARLFCGTNSASICWEVHAGNDFLEAIESQVKSWGINWRLRKISERLSTRGLLVYEDDTFGRKL